MKSFFIAVIFTLSPVIFSEKENSKVLKSKILGGRHAQASYVVSIKYENLCVGAAALISDKHAITSGHIGIMFNRTHFKRACITVRRSYNIGKAYYFEEIFYHESFDSHVENPVANFAIICLEDHIPASDNIMVITLSNVDITPDTEANVLGWEAYSLGHSSMTSHLKELRVRIIPPETCLNYHTNLCESQICAVPSLAYNGQTHYGDLGDPLVDDNGQLVGVLTHLGLNSNTPSIYTKLFEYNSFIESIINPSSLPEVIDVPKTEHELCDLEK